ncbi:hypothetical protein [uncultured Cedecea sp.]|nr:hypothetical protein [uncultured Cedecea sp.]
MPKDNAEKICQREGYYLLAVKGTQDKLYRKLDNALSSEYINAL